MKEGKSEAEVEDELTAIVELNPSRLDSLELAVLKFTRKVLIQPEDLGDADFETLRKEGVAYSEIVRIIAIIAWSVGTSVIGRAFESEPEMPEFAKGLKRLKE